MPKPGLPGRPGLVSYMLDSLAADDLSCSGPQSVGRIGSVETLSIVA